MVTFPRIVVSIVAFALAPSLLPAAEPDSLPPVASWIPQEAVAVLEITAPGALLDPLLGPDVERFVTALPGYEARTKEPGFLQLVAVVRLMEARLGTDWRTAVRKLFHGGATLAFGPTGESLLAVDADEPKVLEEIHEMALGFAKAEALKQNAPDRVKSAEYRGLTGWSLGPEEFHVIVGRRLLVSNRREVLEMVLDLKAEAGRPSLAGLQSYKDACAAAPRGAAMRAFVDLEAVRRSPDAKAGLLGERNPMGSLLLGGIVEALRDSAWLSLGVEARGGSWALEATLAPSQATTSELAAFALPREAGAGAASHPAVPRRIAAISLWRDLAGFYGAKDELFPERTSGLIFFENMMGIFFSGMHLADEVFAETRPEIQLVVAGQEYDPAVGTPAVRIPAFALVLRMKDPKKFGEIMEEAWQKALGLVNFTRGQQAQPGMVLGRRTHAGVEYTIAAFRSPKEEERKDIDVRFNFSPSIATVGEHLILSSASCLARDLIDAVSGNAIGAPVPGAHTLAVVDGQPLADILQSNREPLIRQNMVEKGHSREKAEQDIGLLLAIAARVRDIQLTGATRDGRQTARLELNTR